MHITGEPQGDGINPRSEPLEALRALHEGLHAPDGDVHWYLQDRLRRVLGTMTSPEELVGFIDNGCPPHLTAACLYSAAVKTLRASRFRAAKTFSTSGPKSPSAAPPAIPRRIP